MAEFVVSASMGVMNPLLAKLTKLAGDEYKKLKGLPHEVGFLKRELSAMKALLEKMDSADELDPQAKNWRKDIIDMSYDIEDYIDDYMVRVDEPKDKVGILEKASRRLKRIKDRYRITNQIQEIKARVFEASERRMRYKVDECISSPTSISIDPRLSAIYKESTNLVGIDKQKEELVKWVMDEGEQLKVLSIVGFGGLGKTTLANEVYREVRGQFNCNMFVSISQKADMTRLLSSVLSHQLHLTPPSYACEVKDLINILGGYLQDKRFLIVVDDLWNVREWNIISCAFPRNDKKSRVIVTTRIEDVAKACCSDQGCDIHIMKPLCGSDSRKLFFRRIFGLEDACPSQLVTVSSEILKKCGGLPLAIITIASILACQPTRVKEQWEYIKNSLAHHSAANPTLEDMMHILGLSYEHLPRHLKACFLYIGLYPEDKRISKNELARRWVAEGFVSNSHRQDAWEVAESYFNELINRSMIQPVYDKHNFVVLYCRVHDMMLDLIIRRCREDNFAIVVHDPHSLREVQEKIRRLSVDLTGAEDDTMMEVSNTSCLSQVRSLAIHGASKWMPSPLSEMKFLRVLFLEFTKRVATIDITGIIHLPQLRYLKVEDKTWSPDAPELRILLPSQIQKLRHLETLEMPDASVCTIPSDIVELPHLSHLILPSGVRLPDGIGKMKSLRTWVSYSLHKNSPENIRALGELTNLASLSLNCRKVYWETKLNRCLDDDDDTPEVTWKPALSSCLRKLGKLKQLSLLSLYESCNGDALSLLSPPFHDIEELHMLGWNFSRVPMWMGQLHNLRCLRLGLTLNETNVSWEENVGIIGKLPSLVLLWLHMPIPLTERIEIGSSMGFMVLEQFFIECDGIPYLSFEAGAMPILWKLWLSIHPDESKKVRPPAGLQHLSNLKEIRVAVERRRKTAESEETEGKFRKKMETEGDHVSATELIKGVFREAADGLPSRPAVIDGFGPKSLDD
ncbi:hypothetical protein BS78_07G007100 [Paspalum vaginatum]|nr:hypothetical protein BS78_07G007100 [Paspalum vaginatum]